MFQSELKYPVLTSFAVPKKYPVPAIAPAINNVFNWFANWDAVKGWLGSRWFGAIVIIVIAAIISRKVKS